MRHNNGAVPPGFLGVLQFGGNIVQRLLPGDPLPLVPAAQGFIAARQRLPVFALHGILDPILAVDHLPQGASPQTGALLRIVRAVGMRVIGFLANHDIVDDQSGVVAFAAAVVPAGRRNPLALAGYGRAVEFGSGRNPLIAFFLPEEIHRHVLLPEIAI